MSSVIAMSILRTFSAWFASAVLNSTRLNLVTPSMTRLIGFPNRRSMSSVVTRESSTTSWSSPAATATGSRWRSARMDATSSGWVR